MEQTLEWYKVTLDFAYKISGPIIAIVIIGLVFRYRSQIGEFISKNISRVSGKVVGQDFTVEFNKIKENQSEPVKSAKKEEVEKLREELEFERIYSIIFGSQIDLLKIIKTQPTDIGLLKDVIYPRYRGLYRVFDNWTFDEFIKILLLNNLLEVYVPEERKSAGINQFTRDSLKQYKITQKGLDFLKYIEENNYNDRLF